ncbi:hypothetical protein ACGCUQ_07025 [Eubacteriales bacterium KG127]
MNVRKIKRRKIAMALIGFTIIQSAAIIALYLEVFSEDWGFGAFLVILLLPAAIEVAIICRLLAGAGGKKYD